MNDPVTDFYNHKKLLALSNVVLLHGSAGEHHVPHLEEKILQRVDKELTGLSLEHRLIRSHLKDTSLRFTERKIKKHNDGEIFVQIRTNVRNKDAHVFQDFLDKNQDLSELEIMCDALLRAGVNSITLYIPYAAYQRQDKKDDGRVAIAAKQFFNKLVEACKGKLKRIVTFDLHARQAQGYFDGPLDELSAIPSFASFYRDQLPRIFEPGADLIDRVRVISVDAGGSARARYLARLLRTDYNVLDKIRMGHGKAEFRYNLDWDCRGRTAIVVDDIIDSTSSVVGEFENDIIGPVQYLQRQGADVYLCATHPVFSVKNDIPAEERIARTGVRVLTTDSIPERYPGYYQEHPWMDIISLDFDLAKTMYCNQVGESISDFLTRRERELVSTKRLDINVTRDGAIVDLAYNGL